MKPSAIPPAIQDKLSNQLLIDLDNATRASQARNEIFFRWDAQLRSDPYWAGLKPRWRGACDLESTLTREHHLTQVSRIMAVMRQEQWWVCNPTAPGDEQAASDLEAWLNDKVSQFALAGKNGYDLAYNAARHSYGVMYCGWRQEYEQLFKTVYVHPETNEEVDEELMEPGVAYLEREVVYEDVRFEGLDVRVPHASDVYFIPSNGQGVQECSRVAERMWLSADELLNGVADFGYDEKAVKDILSGKPAGPEAHTFKTERDEADGIRPQEEGGYECFMVIGRPPLLWEDDKSVLNEQQRRRDYLWMCCPSRGVVFKFGPSKYRRRPYVIFPFLREPGRLMGDSVTSLVGGLHREDTIAQRFRIDVRDLAMSPTLFVHESQYDDLQRFKVFPGAMIPYSSTAGPQGIVPLQHDKSGFQAALQDGYDLRQRAAEMFSAQSRGQITPKEQTATEIGMAAQGADEKFDLVLGNFHIGVEDLAPVILSHYQEFMPEEEVIVGTRTIQISPEILDKNFRISANGTSESANPELQLQRSVQAYELMQVNPLLVQAMEAGDLTGIWALSAKLLRRLGFRDPQTIIGLEPTKPPTAEQILQIIGPVIQKMAEAGEPLAVQLLQMVQQVLMQGQMAAPQGQMTAEQPMMIPGQQDQMQELAGLLPAAQGGF